MSTNAKETTAKDFKGKDIVTQIALDGLTAAQQSTRDQLDILRKTRGQREVGQLKIPASLQQGIYLGDAGVEERHSRAGGDE